MTDAGERTASVANVMNNIKIGKLVESRLRFFLDMKKFSSLKEGWESQDPERRRPNVQRVVATRIERSCHVDFTWTN